MGFRFSNFQEENTASHRPQCAGTLCCDWLISCLFNILVLYISIFAGRSWGGGFEKVISKDITIRITLLSEQKTEGVNVKAIQLNSIVSLYIHVMSD